MQDEKYRILSANSIVNMVVNFRLNDADNSEEPLAVTVGVDYAQGRVLFTGERVLGVDYDALEKQILAYIKPGEVKMPLAIPQEFMDRIAQVRSGQYQYPDVSSFQETNK